MSAPTDDVLATLLGACKAVADCERLEASPDAHYTTIADAKRAASALVHAAIAKAEEVSQ